MSDYSYELIKKGLDVSSLRQRTTSSNIANVNTPDYKVNKVEFEKFLKQAGDDLVLNTTHQKHIGPKRDLEPVVEKRESTTFNENGNNVDIDYEMTELAANEIYYSVLISQINARLGNLNYVINK
ncbi:MAG: flagellar basal body rod protein FlgB [Bacilli bacterium]|nr:flagellar basal body rod protein FlgB [Bacilli bacterium]